MTTLGVMILYVGKTMEELSFLRKLSMYGNKIGVKVVIFTPDDVLPGDKTIRGLLYDPKRKTWRRQQLALPSLIFDRCRYQKTDRFKRMTLFRKNNKHLTFLNHPISNKWGTFQVLSEHRLLHPFLPETLQFGSLSALQRMLRKYRLIYVKPIDGTGGRGIIRIERMADGLYRIEGRDHQRRILTPFHVRAEALMPRLRALGVTKRYLVQQGVPIKLPNGRVHDYRLLVQKNGLGQWEVTGGAGRIGAKKSITSNLHGGGAAVPMQELLAERFEPDYCQHITFTMHRLCLDVVTILEQRYGRLCEMALDIAVDPKGGVWLLEVNPKPAREVFHQIGETKIYTKAITRPLEYAHWLEQNKSHGAEFLL